MSAPVIHAAPQRRLIWRVLAWPFRRFRWLWLPGLYVALCWLFMAAATPAPGLVNLPDVPKGLHRVWVLGYGYHTAIYIEQPVGWKLGPPGKEAARFVEFAWGDRGWFYDSDMSHLSGANALLLPSRTVYYVAGYDKPPAEAWPGLPLVERAFSGEELHALAHTLEQACLRTPKGERVEALPISPEYDGRFYSSREFYIGWHSCNHWTIEQLRKSGQDVSELAVFTQNQAFARLDGWKVVR
jgi:hypothetical protein